LFTRSAAGVKPAGPAACLRVMLVGLLCCSLVAMGTIFWVDNSWAFLPDQDPDTLVDISIFFNGQVGDGACSELDPDGDGQIPLAGGKLQRGNGDQDDNKPKPVIIVYQPGALAASNPFNVSAFIWSGSAVKSYLNFGHLKIFPDASGSLSLAQKHNCYNQKAAALYPRGGLLYFHVEKGILSPEFLVANCRTLGV